MAEAACNVPPVLFAGPLGSLKSPRQSLANDFYLSAVDFDLDGIFYH